MKTKFFFLLLLISQISFSQSKDKLMKGKINTLQLAPDGVEVINMRTHQVLRTNAVGEFSMYASIRDVIIFSNFNFEDAKKIITLKDFNAGIFSVNMIPKITQLDEVLVKKDEKLVRSSFWDDAKQFTVAERRLETAAKPFRLNQGLEISNDAIVNALTGKSKRLRKELAVEKKESYLEQIDDLYPEDYYTDTLGIEKDYIAGFKYFVVEDAAFIKNLNANNKKELEYTIIELSQEYKQLLGQ